MADPQAFLCPTCRGVGGFFLDGGWRDCHRCNGWCVLIRDARLSDPVAEAPPPGVITDALDAGRDSG
jgi:hypothetical protein